MDHYQFQIKNKKTLALVLGLGSSLLNGAEFSQYLLSIIKTTNSCIHYFNYVLLNNYTNNLGVKTTTIQQNVTDVIKQTTTHITNSPSCHHIIYVDDYGVDVLSNQLYLFCNQFHHHTNVTFIIQAESIFRHSVLYRIPFDLLFTLVPLVYPHDSKFIRQYCWGGADVNVLEYVKKLEQKTRMRQPNKRWKKEFYSINLYYGGSVASLDVFLYEQIQRKWKYYVNTISAYRYLKKMLVINIVGVIIQL